MGRIAHEASIGTSATKSRLDLGARQIGHRVRVPALNQHAQCHQPLTYHAKSIFTAVQLLMAHNA